MDFETENTAVTAFVLGDFREWLHEDDLKAIAADPYLLGKLRDMFLDGLNWTEVAEAAADEIRDLIAFGKDD
jgi:hypothetical protein